jgi:hypothetical protein
MDELANSLHANLFINKKGKILYVHDKRTAVVVYKGSIKKVIAFNKGYCLGWSCV